MINSLLGVDNKRFMGQKISAACVKDISGTNEMEDFDDREAVYEAHRAEIQYKFRHA